MQTACLIYFISGKLAVRVLITYYGKVKLKLKLHRHMRQLEQAKKSFPEVYLIVGIPGDGDTHLQKGLTVLTDRQRYDTVRHCRWVDEVIEDSPWVVNPDFLAEYKIDYVAHDDIPYAGTDGTADIYKSLKEAGVFLVTQRTEGISTSGIITRIIRDYDKYLIRNFSRGVSRQELNVSWLKKNELDFRRHIADFRDSIKHNIVSTRQELNKYLSPRGDDGDVESVRSTPSAIARNLGLLRKRRRVNGSNSALQSPVSPMLVGSEEPSPLLQAADGSELGDDDEDDDDDKNLLLGLPLLLNGVKSWMGNRKSGGGLGSASDDEELTAASPASATAVENSEAKDD